MQWGFFMMSTLSRDILSYLSAFITGHWTLTCLTHMSPKIYGYSNLMLINASGPTILV